MQRRRFSLLALLALMVFAAHNSGSAAPAARGNANDGAMIVQKNGCMGCHGAKFQGGIGPKLVGIQRRLSAEKIAEVLRHPQAPMPDFGFNVLQIDDIVAYLSNLDGGSNGTPVITLDPEKPTDQSRITVAFPGKAPKRVVARAIMQMGAESHSTETILHATPNRRIWRGLLHFSMGGAWTIEIVYDGHRVDMPLNVEGM
ncbi:MAG: cytochrome c [Candidatus Eremiobacteraeota bacterium]|nr:cytochrome c [Candidatus Eremiobacteraeota bacterium]